VSQVARIAREFTKDRPPYRSRPVAFPLDPAGTGTFFAFQLHRQHEMNAHPAGRGPVAGIGSLQALAVAAITALEESDLVAEAQLIHDRVLSRLPAQLIDKVTVGTQTVWTFTPMVELLMHELRYIATAPDLSHQERRERVHWTLDVAGF
jgi:hypothetical protein